MKKITIKELIKAVNGKLLRGNPDNEAFISSAVSDNRIAGDGAVFFAFKGENTDGHKYVKAALDGGATAVVISDESVLDQLSDHQDRFIIKVDDTLQAAGDLAAWYRAGFDIPVVGVTGSVGKTTMKDMIYSVLSMSCNVTATQGNFNNNIGLPRTVLRIDDTSQAAVLEMGMNHMGEIDYLVNIARPDIAVITNVGDAHIGNLGSRENIFKAKCEIFNGLKEGGLAVMNADDDYLPLLREDDDKQARFDFVWVGEDEHSDIRAVNIDDTREDAITFEMHLHQDGQELVRNVTVPAPGRHMIYPALAAAAVGLRLGMSLENIISGIRSFTPTAKRMETWKLDNNIVIFNDTYNANPQSMKAGLTTLSNNSAGVKIAVLGDMLELGDMEEALHRQVGEAAAASGPDLLITIGPAAAYIADAAAASGLENVIHLDDNDAGLKVLLEKTAKLRRNTDDPHDNSAATLAVYFKASHAMSFDKLASDYRDAVLKL